ncbi:MAG: GMC family oxidoreductase [Pseudomonadota bacterium]
MTEVLQQMPGCVEALKVQRADGAAFEVVAKHYVLAAGGLETPRLLLASRALAPNGLGNAHDVVGRYHMEHPIRSVGVVSLTRRARGISDFTEIRAHQTVRGQATLGLPTVARRANGLLDLHARAYRFHPLERDAVVMSAKALLGVGQPPPGDRHLSLRQVFAGSGKVIRYGAWHYRQKLWPKRMPSHLRLLAFVEQEPDPDNRITLSRQKDRFGTPLPHLTHNESAKMRRSIDKTMELIDHRFRQSGIGTIDYAPETLDDLKHHNGYGLHPMGSTRMSADPQTGVVDANLKVHGIANLHIVGSSVFPTGGAANPTLSIVALALRLARHLSTL